MMPIKILIVDDHAALRKSLKRNLEMYADLSVVGEAVDGLEGVAKAELLQPDVVIMDLSMPKLNGFDATRLIRERLPKVNVLILTMCNSAEECRHAMDSGALGYVLKETAGEELVSGILTVMAGCRFFGTGVTGRRERDPATPAEQTGRWRCRGRLRIHLSR